MSIIFPRLDPNLIITTGVEGPTAVKAIEAIKQDVVQRLSQLGAGKHIQGEVLARLNDGSFIAKVDGTPMRLSLPAATQIGEKLSLTLINLTPRPVFLLNGQNQVTLLDMPQRGKPGEPAQQGYSKVGLASDAEAVTDAHQTSNTNQSLAAPTRPAHSEADATGHTQAGIQASASSKFSNLLGVSESEFVSQQNLTSSIGASSETELSLTGQLINKLLQETSKSPDKLSIKAEAPLLTEANSKLADTHLARQLETNLRQNISSSGLFYESHVAKWSVGQKTMAELQAEPQAKIAPFLEQTILLNQEDSNHAGLTQLIHQQLDILEHQKLQWSGLLTPQIPMQWMIEEKLPDQQQNKAEESEKKQSWQSYLRIELPNLGTVAISIDLSSNKLQLNIKSDALETSSILRSHYADLEKAIEASGTHIQVFTVQHDEQV